LLDGASDESRHVLNINRADAVAAIAGDRKHGKVAHEPSDIVDENVFEAEDDSWPKNRISKAGRNDGLLQLRFSFVIAKGRFK